MTKIEEMKLRYENERCDNAILDQIFKETGAEYGYDDVSANFSAYRDFKAKWARSYKWAEFNISDYMRDAPGDVIVDLADTLFNTITGESKRYGRSFVRYVSSDGFKERYQPLFVKRSRTITKSAQGEHKNLESIYKGLVDRGLVEYDGHLYLTWMEKNNDYVSGHCSSLFDTIMINPLFDADDVDDEVVAFVLFTQLMRIRDGLIEMGAIPKEDLGTEWDKALYPDSARFEEIIHEMGLRL